MKVYLSEKLDAKALEKLRARAEIVDSFEHIEELDAIILRTVKVTREMMVKAKKLKVIGKHGVGYDSIDIAAAKELGIRVVYTPGANAQSVAELIVGLALDASRSISAGYSLCKASCAQKENISKLSSRELYGKTVGLIGLGSVARIAAEILKNGFNMKLVAFDGFVPDEVFQKLGAERMPSVEALIRASDVVNISVPLTDETKNMISDAQFECFKPDAVLVNAARGGIVDEQALYRALTTGKLRAAASDVFVSEPPSAANPLIGLPNFVATPHVGGSSAESNARVGMAVVDEVLRVLDGQAPLHPVV